jgi:ABC-type methionine transport system permease subunit
MFMGILVGIAIYFIIGLIIFQIMWRKKEHWDEAREAYKLCDSKVNFNLFMLVIMLTVMICWLPALVIGTIRGTK